MADKDVDGIIAALASPGSMRDVRIIATQVPSDRAMPAAELAARWRRLRARTPVEAVSEVGAALDRALASAPGTIVVAGSLYIVGEARRRWLDDPRTRDPEVPGA
jgi:folylpolyglutamate synthase/dihydropteroate synthase